MSLSCTVSEIRQDIGRKLPTATYPMPIWRPRWGSPSWNFAEIFGTRKLESQDYLYYMVLFALSYI